MRKIFIFIYMLLTICSFSEPIVNNIMIEPKKISHNSVYTKDMDEIFNLVLSFNFDGLKEKIVGLSGNEYFSVIISLVVISVVLLLIIFYSLYLLYQNILRNLFEETRKKLIDKEPEVLQELYDDVLYKDKLISTDIKKENKIYTTPEPEIYNSKKYIEVEDDEPEELINNLFEVEENAISHLIHYVKKKDMEICTYKNKTFDSLMKFVENQLDAARATLISYLKTKLIEIDKIEPDKISLNTTFQVMSFVSTAVRPILLSQIRSFLRFEDEFINKAGDFEGNSLFDDTDVESRTKFLMAKYVDFFQINSMSQIHLSLLNINAIMEELKPLFQSLLREVFDKHLKFLKDIRTAMKNADIKIDNKRMQLFHNIKTKE